MKVIGICGGSGSGKSTVSDCFKALGGIVFDADAIYHDLVSRPGECLDALALAFGKEIIQGGQLDRAKLRSIVFSDENKRLLLNQITHAYVIREIHQGLSHAEEEGRAFAVIDAPLLLESGLDQNCDLVLAVVADESERIRRITARDRISPEEARSRLKHQIKDEELIRRCGYVIRNNGDRSELDGQCRKILLSLGH